MAAASPEEGLQKDATCPICLEYYKDPVTTKCGHNFCRACIPGCSEGGGRALPCPQCREICPQEDLRPNRQLQSMVEFVKQLSAQRKRRQEEEVGDGLCEEHEERLKLFCAEDEKLICVVCRESKDHKTHAVSPIKEATQEYTHKLQEWWPTLRAEMDGLSQTKLKEDKDCSVLMHKLQEWWPTLRAEMDGLSQTKLKEDKDCSVLMNKLEAENRKIVTKFEKQHQLLKEQEETLLGRLEERKTKIAVVENAKKAKLSAEISSLEDLITEIEKKCEQPAGELLKDVSSTLSRCEQVKVQTLEGIRKKYKEHMTLDEDTAHGGLALSEAGRRVTHPWPGQTPRKDHPKRFTEWHSVLGTEGFTSGRHYWEMELLQEGGWHLGVAQESVSRKEKFTHRPEEGVWAVMWDLDGYRALTSPPTPLVPPLPPQKLGVYLDYEGGRLSVYNASTMGVVFTFTGATFSGRVWPYFRLWRWTDLRLV